MLQKLLVKNYALIEHAEIEFSHGFSVITGETGAGKSIILGALSLLLGARADLTSAKDPKNKCWVEGEFLVHQELSELFNRNNVDFQHTTSIRREILPEGKSRAFINDTPVNLSILKEISSHLVDLNLQKENIRFLNAEVQISAIDAYAQNQILIDNYLQGFRIWKDAERTLYQLKKQQENSQKDLDYQLFQWNELNDANLFSETEQIELEQELKRLESAAVIGTYLHQLDEYITEQMIGPLQTLNQNGQKFQAFGETLKSIFERTQSGILEWKDIASEASKYINQLEVDPQRLLWVEQRLSVFYHLQKKHQCTDLLGLINKREELFLLIHGLENLDDLIIKSSREVEISFNNLLIASKNLTESRKNVIPEFEQRVLQLLPEISMNHARFEVRLDISEQLEPNENGSDHIRFFFNANPGMNLLPVDEVASGGELSRLTLVIKSIISEKRSLPTLIFDEIDSGISGETGLQVGRLIKKLSKGPQVLAITHLPQMAAYADNHYWVQKVTDGNKTESTLKSVTGTERIQAIAQLIGGTIIGGSAEKYAEDLLKSVAD
jgi:DNA repair protein RecN (Recombination protein N)